MGSSSREEIADFLYQHDYTLGFCGHDVDGAAMNNIIECVAVLLNNHNPNCTHSTLNERADGRLECARCGLRFPVTRPG